MQFEFDRERMFEILADEIYGGDSHVFLRELLQYSIDAIRMRQEVMSKKGMAMPGVIFVTVDHGDNGDAEVVWWDNGIGMDEYVVRNYLAVAGKSYYTSDDFKRLGLNMDPISRFGVGILSCFMVAEKIDSPTQTGIQPIQNIDSVMAVRAQELTNLQTRHEKTVLDSVNEGEHCAVLLSAAHNEIVKRSIALEQRKNELSLSNAVKNDGKYLDPLERSYRDALAASNLEIQTKNDVIKKKKSDIARLRTVRDALSGATDESGDGNTRLDRDKLYYDSLLSIAGQELSAIIAMRDIARQDSASAEAGLKQSMRKTVPVPERGVSSIQKDVTNATAEYQRALDDSVKIVNAIPNTLQPYAQSIRTIDALITVKGKELANLQDLLDQTSKDVSKMSKRNAELLAAAHSEIVKRSGVLEKTKSEHAQAVAAKNAAQNDTDPSVRNYKQTLEAAKLQLNVQSEQIATKKDEISRLQKIRDAVNARIKNPSPAAVADETRVAALSPKDNAQKISDDIYVMVGEGRIDEAASTFSKQQALLKTNLDQESFTALKMTITEMGGKIK